MVYAEKCKIGAFLDVLGGGGARATSTRGRGRATSATPPQKYANSKTIDIDTSILLANLGSQF